MPGACPQPLRTRPVPLCRLSSSRLLQARCCSAREDACITAGQLADEHVQLPLALLLVPAVARPDKERCRRWRPTLVLCLLRHCLLLGGTLLQLLVQPAQEGTPSDDLATPSMPMLVSPCWNSWRLHRPLHRPTSACESFTTSPAALRRLLPRHLVPVPSETTLRPGMAALPEVEAALLRKSDGWAAAWVMA